MLTKCTSFSSVESDVSETGSRNGLLSRAGTMSEGAICRKDVNRTKLRPMSEIPQGLHSKELEASFEVRKQFSAFTLCMWIRMCMLYMPHMQYTMYVYTYIVHTNPICTSAIASN